MKKRILPFLKSPDTNLAGMKVYGTEVLRDNTILKNLEENQILDSDDIISGILVSEQSNILYPISNCIPILLSFNDIDTFHYIPLIKALKNVCPVEYHAIFKETLSMIHKSMLTPDGEWNRDEMRYYDAEVDTYENRTRMVETIKKIPVHIF